jgi:GAF domain-containing protein
MQIHSEWTAPGHDPVGGAAARLPASNLAARERRTVSIADVESASELDDPSLGGREALVELGTKAVLATPILVFDDVIGVFALHRSEVGRWTDGEVALAESVAGEAGLAIHTARLLREEGQRVERQSALLKAAQVVTSDLRFTSVVKRLVEEVAELLGADAADCWILEPHRDSLRCRAVFGLPKAAVGRRIAAAGTHEAAIEGGKPVLKRNFRETEDPPPSTYYAEFEDACWVSAPRRPGVSERRISSSSMPMPASPRSPSTMRRSSRIVSGRRRSSRVSTGSPRRWGRPCRSTRRSPRWPRRLQKPWAASRR